MWYVACLTVAYRFFSVCACVFVLQYPTSVSLSDIQSILQPYAKVTPEQLLKEECRAKVRGAAIIITMMTKCSLTIIP